MESPLPHDLMKPSGWTSEIALTGLTAVGAAAELDRALSMFTGCLGVSPQGFTSETADHLRRTGHYAAAMAQALGWSADRITRLALATPLHDLGKLAIPGEILEKPGALTAEEIDIMRRHPLIGHDHLTRCDHPILRYASVIALTHHERWDGSGYPWGLAGEAIPIEGRIVALIDTYDALRMARSYKPALSHDTALRILLHGDGRTRPEHFDPRLLALLSDIHGEFRRIYRSYCGDALPGAPAGCHRTAIGQPAA